MAKYIHAGQPFEDELRRIINERTEKAIHVLNETDDPDAAVHQSRKEFKKIRAAWRLVRDDIGQKAYREKNVFYRDLGRRLSDLRDSKAVVESLRLLEDRYGQVLENSAFDKAAQTLRRRQEEQFGDRKVALIQEIAADLTNHREKMNAFHLSADFPENMISSLVRVYRRGFDRFHDSEKEMDTEVLHTWRKRAKYLRYQFHILRGGWPEMFKTMENELHHLTDLLGDYHDLVMLKEHVGGLREDLDLATREAFMVLATRRQIDLYETALVLGAKLYAEEPRAFKRRMGKCLAELLEE